MTIFGRELVILLIVHPDHVVLHQESVFVIIIHLMPCNFHVPARKVLAVEEGLPFFFVFVAFLGK
ncbi:hypothetical protein D3C86_2187820 [compost metagenome]